jgi:hypothetical protein
MPTAKAVKSLMRTAGTSPARLDRKIGRVSWANLTDAERAADLAYQTWQVETGPARWGRAWLVDTGWCGPLAWFERFTELRGGTERYPVWRG